MINELLPKWYKPVTLSNLSEETFKKRISEINRLIKTKNIEWFYDCIRLYLGKPIDNDIFIKELKSAFGKSDAFFHQNDSSLELQILGGAIIFETIFGLKKSDYNTLALITDAAIFLISNKIMNEDICEKIHLFLNKEGDRIRNKELTVQEDSILSFNSEVTEASNTILSTKFRELVNQINQHQKIFILRINEAYRTINFLREESNLLWWSFGSYSEGQLRSEIDKYSFPFLIGNELADLIMTSPPALVTYQFLRKAINQNNFDEVNESFLDFINGIDSELCTKLANQYNNKLSNLTPIHFALHKRKESGDGDAWITSFEKKCLVMVNTSVSIFDFTKQFITELLILKSK